MIKFVESQFEILLVYEFQTKANSYEDICCVSVWSYVSLWVSNQSEFSWKHLLSLRLKLYKVMSFKQKWILGRHLLSLSLKLCIFMRFKRKRILMQTFVECYFEIMSDYEFHTKPISYEGICWVTVFSYLSLRVLNKGESL